ncbi:MAG TPA: hypothetical protein DIU47_03835 [Candidatus Pacebacteria bacterium]|nr:hypothetical protein [Candidatus Paceibacterota bacterium]
MKVNTFIYFVVSMFATSLLFLRSGHLSPVEASSCLGVNICGLSGLPNCGPFGCVAICTDPTEIPDTKICLGVGAIGVCTCSPNPDCGEHGQPACFRYEVTRLRSQHCRDANTIPKETADGSFVCLYKTEDPLTWNTPSFKLCARVSDDTARIQCENCSNKDGVWTAIGCIPTDSNGILTAFVRLALSMGGGIVLLKTLAAAFQLTTSKGDPKATEEAKNKITAAVSGLLFIIFSMVLLKTIGITVLQIPGF